MKSKTCSYSECGKLFPDKNPKKRFCSLSCKNKAAYQYDQENYVWENRQFKARRKNIQIVEYLMFQKKTKVLFSELKILGFDSGASHIPFSDNDGFQIFRYGNIGIKILSKTECELFKILEQ